MKTIVIEGTPCPKCEKPLPAGALAGLCPACLLAQGMASEDAASVKGRHFEPPPLAEVARLFPQLEILDLLGAGGMGAVYKARQPALDRIVALKILPATNASGVNFEERFNREARALARLHHPNIVTVHEFGKAGALHFFIMEFVDGANLRQLEQSSRLAPREALQIIPQICDALQYAHDEGVVHRDIKPENVLVDRKGRVKIADFGLAKIMGQEAEAQRLTMEGQVMGTPHYMAPEQVEKPLSVDHRADIYALGVVFYEMLTGDLPLGKFPPPSRKFQLDVRLDDVVLRALENDPARRYQQASEVKTQVKNIADTPAPAATAPAAPAPEQSFIRWAGFPIVIDRAGERRVNRKEAFKMFAILFGVLTIAFGLVSLIAGQTLFGWLGISGKTSLQVRMLIAGIATAVGVLWALRSKAPAKAPPQTPQGTVILSPERFSRKAIIGVCWIPFILFILLTVVAVPLPAGQQHTGPSWWQIGLGLLTLPLAFTAPLGTTILGWLAVGDIRRSRGRIGGLPLALFDGLFFPLLLLDGLILWAWHEVVVLVGGRWSTNPANWGPNTALVVISGVAICGLVDFLIIRRAWRAVRLTDSPAVVGGDWWWNRKPGAALIGLACVAIILATAWRREQWGVFKNAPQQIARKDSTSGALVARLPNGGAMELLALSDAGAAPDEWWRPDGKRLDATSFEIKTPGRVTVSNTLPKDLLFRFVNLPEGTTFPLIEASPGSDYSTGDTVRRDGQLLDDTWPVQMAWPKSVRTVTLRLGLSLVPWHTVSLVDTPHHNRSSMRQANDPNWTVDFHHAGERDGETQIIVVRSPEPNGWQTRIVAVDTNGVEHTSSRGTGTTGEKVATWTYTFPLPIKQVKEFRAQLRPLHWVEFRDVALQGKGLAKKSTQTSRAEVQVAARNPQTGVFYEKIGRHTVELLAVSDGNAAPNAWWTPDGTAVPDTLYEVLRSGDSFSSGRTNKDFIFRWKDLPNDASGPSIVFDDQGGGSGGGEVFRDGKLLQRAWPLTGAFLPSATHTTARVGFAIGLWQTISTHAADQSTSTHTLLPEVPQFDAKVHQVGENAGNAEVTMVMAKQDRNWELRVVAIDTNGTQHMYWGGTATPADPTMIWTYTFRQLPLAKVKQFEVQVRPYQWIEFRDVQLQPRDRSAVGRSTKKFVPTRFGAEREVQFTEMFDFDKGEAGEFPTQPDGTKVFRGIKRNSSWMMQQGFDVDAGTNELRLLQMTTTDLKNDEWDTITANEFERRMRTQIYMPPRLPSAPKATLPVAHGFRTRDHTMGILKITALSTDSAAVTLRYKLLERAHLE